MNTITTLAESFLGLPWIFHLLLAIALIVAVMALFFFGIVVPFALRDAERDLRGLPDPDHRLDEVRISAARSGGFL